MHTFRPLFRHAARRFSQKAPNFFRQNDFYPHYHQQRRGIATLEIQSLKCTDTSDVDTADTIKLYVWGDGAKPIKYEREMNNNDDAYEGDNAQPGDKNNVFNINDSLAFTGHATFFITDKDSLSADDILGLARISESSKVPSITFTGDDSNYELSIKITPHPPTSSPVYQQYTVDDIANPTLATFRPKSILCLETEDTQTDEIQLQADLIRGNNTLCSPSNARRLSFPSTPIDMKQGAVHNLELNAPELGFEHNLNLKLIDVDNGEDSNRDSDDLLGMVRLPATKKIRNGVASFEQDDAHYKLIYDIIPAPITLQGTPLTIVPKDFIDGGIKVWVGAFQEISEPAKWRVIDDKKNVVTNGQITSTEWNLIRPDGSNDSTEVITYTEIVIAYEGTDYQLDPNKTYDIQVLYEQLPGLTWDMVPTNKSPLPGTTSPALYAITDENKYVTLQDIARNFVDVAQFRPLPSSLPSTENNAFKVLLGSCYQFDYDNCSVSDAFIRLFYPPNIPHVKIFSGDQVYLDHPAHKHAIARFDKESLARQFTGIYQKTWSELRNVHKFGANYFISDDHEFYNGYPTTPEFMAYNPFGLDAYLKDWAEVATKLFTGVQNSGSAVRFFNIGDDISFCLADTRVDRDSQDVRFLSQKNWFRVRKWLSALQSPGILVLSQPMFVLPSAVLQHSSTNIERNQANFMQYETLVKAIAESRQDIVVLSGDVHFSRFAETTLQKHNKKFYEIVSSPMSLLEVSDTIQDDTIETYAVPEDGWEGGWTWDGKQYDKSATLNDARPERFPPDSVDTDIPRSDITYSEISRPKLIAATPDTKAHHDQRRAEENFTTLKLFKPVKDSNEIKLKVETWNVRLRNSNKTVHRDWTKTISLFKSENKQIPAIDEHGPTPLPPGFSLPP